MHVLKEVSVVLRPIGGSVDRSAVTKQKPGWVQLGLDLFQAALDVEDRSLRRDLGVGLARTRKPTCEKNGRRLGHDHDAVTELATQQLGGGRLSTTRSTSHGDAKR